MIGFNQILNLIIWLTNAPSNFVPMFLFISMLFCNIHNSIVNTTKQWKLGRNMLIRWYVPQSLCIFTEEILLLKKWKNSVEQISLCRILKSIEIITNMGTKKVILLNLTRFQITKFWTYLFSQQISCQCSYILQCFSVLY